MEGNTRVPKATAPVPGHGRAAAQEEGPRPEQQAQRGGASGRTYTCTSASLADVKGSVGKVATPGVTPKLPPGFPARPPGMPDMMPPREVQPVVQARQPDEARVVGPQSAPPMLEEEGRKSLKKKKVHKESKKEAKKNSTTHMK